MIVRYVLSILGVCAATWLAAQTLLPFRDHGKWGFRDGQGIRIPAQYDTIFGFDGKDQVCMAGIRSAFNTVVNPLTGEETADYDYMFITRSNTRISLLPNDFPDSIPVFKNQQELAGNYKEHGNVFKILFGDKLYLCTKSGHQISAGFDNIYPSPLKPYYITETYSESGGKPLRIKGMIDSAGHVIAKCHYKSIQINPDDSTVYACGALYSANANDDVFDLKGHLLHSDKRHVEFASKTEAVFKVYKPEEKLILADYDGKRTKDLDGDRFYYLRNGKGLLVQGESWYVLDLYSFRKTKVNKEEYFKNLLTLYYEQN